MKDYGTVTGSERPLNIDIKPEIVLVASDIEEVQSTYEGETRNEFQYHLVEYTKDEFLLNQQASIDYLTMLTEDL